MELEFIKQLVEPDETSKIVLLVLDGLGGLPTKPDGLTELETADTPNLDDLYGHSAGFLAAARLAPGGPRLRAKGCGHRPVSDVSWRGPPGGHAGPGP